MGGLTASSGQGRIRILGEEGRMLAREIVRLKSKWIPGGDLAQIGGGKLQVFYIWT